MSSADSKVVFVPKADGGMVVDGIKGSYMLLNAIDLDQAKAVILALIAALNKTTAGEINRG